MNDLNSADYPSATQVQEIMPVDSYGIVASPAVSAGSVFAFTAIILVLSIAMYIYTAYCLYAIAKKTNTPNPWYAYIPILNLVLIFQIIRQSPWWILAMFIPIVNIFVMIWMWMELAAVCNRPKWWGILMIISPVNLILLWFMAFREGDVSQTPPVPPVAPTNVPAPQSAPESANSSTTPGSNL